MERDREHEYMRESLNRHEIKSGITDWVCSLLSADAQLFLYLLTLRPIYFKHRYSTEQNKQMEPHTVDRPDLLSKSIGSILGLLEFANSLAITVLHLMKNGYTETCGILNEF